MTSSYSKRGNRLAESGKKASQSFAYDATNHLTSGTNWKGDKSAYTYNALSARVNNTQTTHAGQVYNRDYVIDYTSYERNDLAVDSPGYMAQKHVYTAWGERLEQFTERGNWDRLLYVHEDVMGNTMHYTKATGQSFGELRYDVWGAPTLSGKLLNNDNGNFVAANFTGHTYDTVLDIYFAEARFYDAKNRQWMSTDPIKDGLNWYAYCAANPVTWFDPDGWEAVIIGTTVITDVSTIDGKIYANMNDVTKAYGGTVQARAPWKLGPDVTWDIPNGAGQNIKVTYDSGVFKINNQNAPRDTFKSQYGPFMYNNPDGRVLVNTKYFSTLVCSKTNSYHEVLWYGNTSNYATDEQLKKIIDAINASDSVKKHPELMWGQEKVDAIWDLAESTLLNYGVDLDPRLIMAVLRVEGTGSFNTDNINLAGDGGAGVQLDFEKDIGSQNANLFGKLIGYIHYKDDFAAAVVANNGGDYSSIDGEGNIFQYFNWETPIYRMQSEEFTLGVYADAVKWYSLVEENYNWQTLGKASDSKDEFGGSETYSKYAKTISSAIADKLIGNPNFVYPEYVFAPKYNERSHTESGGNRNDNFSIAAK